MTTNIPQFVPQSFCLSCDGCCRFGDPDDNWRPRVARNDLNSKNNDPQSPFHKAIDRQGRLQTQAEPVRGFFPCGFLNPEENRCRIYADRPFQCRLYPFLLEKKDKKIAVSVHLACPYVQEKRHMSSFDVYADELKSFLKKDDVRKFLSDNDYIVEDYAAFEDEIEELFDLP